MIWRCKPQNDANPHEDGKPKKDFHRAKLPSSCPAGLITRRRRPCIGFSISEGLKILISFIGKRRLEFVKLQVMACLSMTMDRIKQLCLVSDNQIRRFGSDESAATAIEYAMIAAGIAACISGVIWNLGSALKSNFYDKLAALLP